MAAIVLRGFAHTALHPWSPQHPKRVGARSNLNENFECGLKRFFQCRGLTGIGKFHVIAFGGWKQQGEDFKARCLKQFGHELSMFPIKESLGLSGNSCNEQSSYSPGQECLEIVKLL